MKKPKTDNQDGVYFLKILLYMILGLQWVWLTNDFGNVKVSLPIGLRLGVLFTRHEHFKIDRKIEYAILLVAALVGFLLEAGIYFKVL